MHLIKVVLSTKLLNKKYSQIGCKEIIISMRKDQEVKPIRKVNRNVQKEKPMRMSQLVALMRPR